MRDSGDLHDIPESAQPNPAGAAVSLQDLITKEVFEWVDTIAVCIIAVVLVFTFVLRVVGVYGPSMKDTLHTGDKLIITHLNYKPKFGDIVVISMNHANRLDPANADNIPIIKRIIALENQTVDIDFEKGEVYVDGQRLDEPYIRTLTFRDEGAFTYPVTVPEGHIFVLGDNRDESKDSRDPSIGMVDERYILGKAVFRLFPLSVFGPVK